MENRKYELTNKTRELNGYSLYRIKALKDFDDVGKGDLGGWIESEYNLSQYDDCWVYEDAKVYGDARLYDNAKVFGNASVYGDAQVYGNASVNGNAKVGGYAKVYGSAWIYDNAKVFGSAWIYGDAIVYNNASVHGDAKVCGDTRVYGNVCVLGDACVTNKSDILTISNIGSRNATTTFYKNIDGGISVVCGCFKGTIEEFKEKVINTHGDSFYGQQYMLVIELAKFSILGKNK